MKCAQTVLLVEDTVQLLDLYRWTLEANGYTVLAARDGPGAIQVAKRHGASIDILVTDLVMPGMGGQELARRLLATRPTMKVLYVSGYADEKTVASQSPKAALLRKPVDADVLRAKLQELLTQRQPGEGHIGCGPSSSSVDTLHRP